MPLEFVSIPNTYQRHYIMVSAFALSILIMALIFLFVHTVILED